MQDYTAHVQYRWIIPDSWLLHLHEEKGKKQQNNNKNQTKLKK